MRFLRLRFLFATLAPLIWGSSEARADWWPYTETVYTTSSAALALPTSYVVPSSYLMPTSAVVPTVYATAYYPETYAWTPTAYYATSYVPTGYYVQERVARRPLFSRPLFGRRRDYIVPTTIYYPTTTVVPTTARYYAPTVLEYPVVAEVRYRSGTAGCGTCDDSVVVASAPVSRPAPARVERNEEEDAPPARRPSRSSEVERDPADEPPTKSSTVPPSPDDEPAPLSDLNAIQPAPIKPQPSGNAPPAAVASPPPSPAATPEAVGGTANRSSAQPQTDAAKVPATATPKTDTTATAPEKKQESVPPASGASKSESTGSALPESLPPIAPSSPTNADSPAGLDEPKLPLNRESMKPSTYGPRTSPFTLLKGRVRSSDSSEPESNVRVTVSSRTNAFEDRIAYSNESGRFSLKVPDGDWTVKVTMPSGKIYPVYRITVSGGVIIDDQGQDVPALAIVR